jgi:hypothetical protein
MKRKFKDPEKTKNKMSESSKGNKNALGYKHTEEELQKMSFVIKNQYKTGERKAWNKGLNKETDERIKKASSKISECTKKAMQNPKIKEKMKKGMAIEREKNPKHNEECVKSLIPFKKGYTPWNKGMTKEKNENIGGGGWNKGLTKETDERLNKSNIKRKKTFVDNNINEKISKTVKNLWKNEEYRNNMQEKALENTLSGKNKQYGFREGIREDLKEYGYIRSAFEANFIRYLKYKNIKFEYQIPILLSNNKWYVCDFYLSYRNNLFLETKGYLRECSKTKYELLQKDYPRMNWQMLMQNSDNWKQIVKEYSGIIPNWEFYKTNKTV